MTRLSDSWNGWPQEPTEEPMRGWRLAGVWALAIGGSWAVLTAVVYVAVKVAEAV